MTKTIIKVFAGIALSMAIAGCSMIKKSTPGGGGGGGAAKGPLGDTMADAVPYKRGDTITAPAGCHTSGYAKLEIAGGEAVKLQLTVTSPTSDEVCVGFDVLNKNGGNGGVMDELCSTKSPKTYDVTIPDGGAVLQMSEGGACKGATIAVAVQ